MTKTQMRITLNNELSQHGSNRQIKKIDEINNQTVLIFKNGIDMKTLKYLNDRFAHGISITNTDHSLVFINTPNETKVEI